MPDKTRGERIGRAAWDEYLGHATADLGHPRRSLAEAWDMWAAIALAAVSRAREIDTCETCANQGYDDNANKLVCYSYRIPCDSICGEGCNRHQPKE